jgi:hypothetical protein
MGDAVTETGMKPEIPFEPFSKIHRLNRTVTITEKIDGTNATVYVDDTGSRAYAGSRNKWIGIEDDNFGFARWVRDHHDELLAFGPGRHCGEWWGQGIGRKYGLSERRFSLFNTARWSAESPPPACCHVVPVLARGPLLEVDVPGVLAALTKGGSVAAPGFMRSEGIVVFHEPSQNMYKMTLDKNDGHKGAA